MTKSIIIAFVLGLLSNIAFGQLPIHADSLYTFIKFNSVLRNNVDWNVIDAKYNKQIHSASTLRDTMRCFVKVLEGLGDVHSQIYLNNKLYGNYPEIHDTTLAWIKPINDKAVALTNILHTSKITENIGYIRVPSYHVFEPLKVNEYAQLLYNNIIKLSENNAKAFIIDLRLNGGGNLYPMLSGLSLLLGNTVIGYETDLDEKLVRSWEIVGGNFVIGGYQTTELLTQLYPKLQSVPVVVLLGPVTKSSGSMTAIAFKQRANTTFIGEPTADGYTTSNGYFQFAPNLTLNFATHYVADRKQNVYKTTVKPDTIIYRGDNFENLLEDKKIKAAIDWLQNQH